MCVRFFMFLKSLKVECTFSVAIGLIKWSPLKNNHIIEACIVTACVPTSHWFIFFCLKHFSIHNTHIYIYMYIETIIIPKPYDFNNNWMFNNMNTKKTIIWCCAHNLNRFFLLFLRHYCPQFLIIVPHFDPQKNYTDGVKQSCSLLIPSKSQTL